jgi:hypothetical protein
MGSYRRTKFRNNRHTFLLGRLNTKYFENWALLGYYIQSSGNFFSTFRDNLLVTSFFSICSWTLKIGPIVCLETSVRNYYYSLRNNPEERSSHLLRGGSLKSRNPRSILITENKSSNTCNIVFYFKFSRQPKFKYSGFIHECILIYLRTRF